MSTLLVKNSAVFYEEGRHGNLPKRETLIRMKPIVRQHKV